MTKHKAQDKNKATYKHLIIAFIVIFLIFYIIMHNDLNIHEGWLGLFDRLFVFVFFAVPFFALVYIGFFRILLHLYKNDKKREFLKYLIGIGFFWIILLFPLFSGVLSIYHLIFEETMVILIDDYALQDENTYYRGDNHIFYLNFDNKSFRINPKTYYQLNSNRKYTLKVIYKPKSELICSLQILPK